MLGDDELTAIGITAGLWLVALGAFVLRRRRAARAVAAVALMATLATLALLRAGTGHRG